MGIGKEDRENLILSNYPVFYNVSTCCIASIFFYISPYLLVIRSLIERAIRYK